MLCVHSSSGGEGTDTHRHARQSTWNPTRVFAEEPLKRRSQTTKPPKVGQQSLHSPRAHNKHAHRPVRAHARAIGAVWLAKHSCGRLIEAVPRSGAHAVRAFAASSQTQHRSCQTLQKLQTGKSKSSKREPVGPSSSAKEKEQNECA